VKIFSVFGVAESNLVIDLQFFGFNKDLHGKG